MGVAFTTRTDTVGCVSTPLDGNHHGQWGLAVYGGSSFAPLLAKALRRVITNVADQRTVLQDAIDALQSGV